MGTCAQGEFRVEVKKKYYFSHKFDKFYEKHVYNRKSIDYRW